MANFTDTNHYSHSYVVTQSLPFEHVTTTSAFINVTSSNNDSTTAHIDEEHMFKNGDGYIGGHTIGQVKIEVSFLYRTFLL